MGIIEDIIKALERVPGWKRIAATSDDLDILKKRVDVLEAKLAPATGEICPKCRQPTFRVIDNRPMPHFEWAGKSLDTLQCDSCGHKVTQQHQR